MVRLRDKAFQYTDGQSYQVEQFGFHSLVGWYCKGSFALCNRQIFRPEKNGVFLQTPYFFLRRAFRTIFRPSEAANEGLNAWFFGLRHENAFCELLNLELSKNETKEKKE